MTTRNWDRQNDLHEAFADFVNRHKEYKAADLPPVTPKQTVAIAALYQDFRKSPKYLKFKQRQITQRADALQREANEVLKRADAIAKSA